MIRPIRATLLLLVAMHVLAASALAGLHDDVQRAIREAPLKGATVAVSIRDTASGVDLVSVNGDRLMVPASNMKLITTGAALHALGPKFEFTTRLMLDGDRLIIVGDGDPAFGDPALLEEMTLDGHKGVDVESFLKLWVKPVVDSGLKKISEVVVDDRIFDREFVHKSWPGDQLNRRYCAQVSGLNFHANVLHFFPRPNKGARPILSDVRPEASWIKISNAATSNLGSNDRSDVWIARKIDTNDLTFHGNVKFAYKEAVPVTVHDMPELFAHLFADRLQKAGVAVGKYRVATLGDPVTAGKSLGPVISTPLSTVITRCNQESQNLYAECLLKRSGVAMTGEPGSWMTGAAIIRHIIHDRLDDPDLASKVIVVDGSGLSAENRVAPAAMTAWLNSLANDERIGYLFLDSLAEAGESGTLQKRMGNANLFGANIQAKTGYINQVSCLSGFVTMPDGRRRSFSVMVNNLKDASSVPLAKKLQDRIVQAIAADMADAEVQLGSD